MRRCEQPFVQSSKSGGDLLLWCPPPNHVNNNDVMVQNGKKKVFCSALPYSQGEDWITKYVYDVNVINSTQQHDAYVECDYVQ